MKTFTKPLALIVLILSIIFAYPACSDDDVDQPDVPEPEIPYDPEEILDDMKVPVKTATASSFQEGEGIELSIDGDMNTMYHSAWDNAADDYFPITLTYNFENVEYIDYLIYYPRLSGTNGLFKEVEIHIATADKPTPTLYKTHDFKGNSGATRIDFDEAIQKPTQILFIVKSGAGDNQGFASCAEMEFYQRNNENYNYLRVFTDETATALKDTVRKSTIQAINNRFFRELATAIYKNEYDSEFRVREYKAWQQPDVSAKLLKTSTYGLRDNVTGIYAQKDEELVIFAGDLHGQVVSLAIQESGKKLDASSYPLRKGMNKIKARNEGLLYIMYYTETGEEQPVKIHIAKGTVNGYFDKSRHTKEDWTRLLEAATYADFDVVGQYAVLTFRTEAFREYTPDGLALINKYDDLVYQQQEFMGLVKYNRMFKNKAHFLVVDDSYMYASSYHTGYNVGTQKEILNPDLLSTTAVWGPAHELGHTHQTRPGLRWAGMAEVTNNIHSLYIQTLWGNQSRLIADGRYNMGFNSTIVQQLALNEEPDVFCRLIPFWQLKLYMMDVLGKEDFYKDIYEFMRVNPDVTLGESDHGLSQLQFVKVVCDQAQLDLTDFFVTWGFLRPVDMVVDDYGKYNFTITQSEIDNVIAEIKAKGYPKPAHNLQYLTDENINQYKTSTPITTGTAKLSGNSVVLEGWSGVAVFEAYNNGVLSSISMSDKLTLRGDVTAYEIWAVGASGEKVQVTITAGDNKVAIYSGEASISQPGEGIERSFDGSMTTLYHSPYQKNEEDFPISLTYNFRNVDNISYILYHPRPTGVNGKFNDFELYIATESNPELTKYGDYDFEGRSEVSRIDFPVALVRPTKIEFRVNPGVGDFVSCAEMEFFIE